MIVMGIDPGVETGWAIVDVEHDSQRIRSCGTTRWKWSGHELKMVSHELDGVDDVQAIVIGLPGARSRITGRDPRVLTKCALTGGLTVGSALKNMHDVRIYVYDEIAAFTAVATIGRYRASPSNHDIWMAFWFYFPGAMIEHMIEQRPKYEHIRDAALFALCIRLLKRDYV